MPAVRCRALPSGQVSGKRPSSVAATTGRTRSRYQSEMAMPPMRVSTPKAMSTSHVSRLRPDEVIYRALSDPQAVSPIIMSTRLHDKNEDIATLRALIDRIYQEQAEARQRAEAARAAAVDKPV